MRVLKLIETPWTPYAVTFSRDGRRLAIGGGTFFGGGGLILVNLEDGKTVARQTVDLLPSAEGLADSGPTISGLCFADERVPCRIDVVDAVERPPVHPV